LPLLDVPQGSGRRIPQPCGGQTFDFKWVQGEELMTCYESSPGFERGFCRICGSLIVNGSPAHPERGYGLALGTLNDDPE
jgi:hypothetical protein